MDVCFDCGGKIKLIAKPGRMHYLEDGKQGEIPQELKLPTCIDCGSINENDVFVKTKLEKITRNSQSNNLRQSMLSFIDETIRDMLSPRYAMFGDQCEITLQLLTLLDMRQFIIYRETKRNGNYTNPQHLFTEMVMGHFKIGNAFSRLKDTNPNEFIEQCRVFVDRLVFVEDAVKEIEK